jgi:hypothetical protein
MLKAIFTSTNTTHRTKSWHDRQMRDHKAKPLFDDRACSREHQEGCHHPHSRSYTGQATKKSIKNIAKDAING